MVSVSRLAGLPQLGHAQLTKLSNLFSGLPEPSGTQSSGNLTGNWSSGTATSPQSSQWIIGIGQPQ